MHESHRIVTTKGFRPFENLWDYGTSQRPCYQFLWSLWGIVRAIEMYDTEKEKAA